MEVYVLNHALLTVKPSKLKTLDRGNVNSERRAQEATEALVPSTSLPVPWKARSPSRNRPWLAPKPQQLKLVSV